MTHIQTLPLEQLEVEHADQSRSETQRAAQHSMESESDRHVDDALKEAARKVNVSVFSLGTLALDEIFRHLSDEQKSVLDLTYRQGMSPQDAATHLHALDASFPDDREAVLGTEYQIACAVGRRIAGFVNELVGAPQNIDAQVQKSNVTDQQLEQIRATIAAIPDFGKEAVIISDKN